MSIKNNLFTVKFSSVIIVLLVWSSLEAKQYKGVVIPLVQTSYKSGKAFGFWGVLKSASRPGKIIKPDILDSDGNIIEPGTTLYELDTTYWKAQLESSKSQVLSCEADLSYDIDNYKRYKTLMKEDAESKEVFQAMRDKYYDSLEVLKEAKAQVHENEIIYRSCKLTAPYQGIVDNIYFMSGYTQDVPTIKVSLLNPIGIKVEMPVNEASKISAASKISIESPSLPTPQGVYSSYTHMSESRIILATSNRRQLPELQDIENSRLSICEDVKPVVRFYFHGESDTLGVDSGCIFRDKKGYYVWKAKNSKTLQPDHGIKPLLKPVKVYVVPDNKERMLGALEKITALKDPGSLEENDVVIKNLSSDIKNNEQALLLQERFILMPGDEVTVNID